MRDGNLVVPLSVVERIELVVVEYIPAAPSGTAKELNIGFPKDDRGMESWKVVMIDNAPAKAAGLNLRIVLVKARKTDSGEE